MEKMNVENQLNGEPESKKEEKNGNSISRKKFLQGVAITGAAGAFTAGMSMFPKHAEAAEINKDILLNISVKELDKPRYMYAPYEGHGNEKPYDNRRTAFGTERTIERHGMKADPAVIASGLKKVRKNIPGFTMLDHALTWASWLPYTGVPILRSWDPIPGISKVPEGMKWEAEPKDNSRYIKKVADVFGCVDCGIGVLDPKWLYEKSGGKQIIISDTQDKPEITNNACIIPRRINRVIMLAVEMNAELHRYSPSLLSCASAGDGYGRMALATTRVTEFIRGLGWTAIPAMASYSILVPQAMDCGLGEAGRNGLLIHPVYGPNIRLTAIFTDLPLEVSKPISFGVTEFCMTCGKCARNCPSKSIPLGDMSYDAPTESNNKGMKRWFCNPDKCIDFWIENGAQDCANCVGTCTYTKPGTWIHNVVKAVSAKTTAFNTAFSKADDALGYGPTYDESESAEFWNSKERPVKWPRVY